MSEMTTYWGQIIEREGERETCGAGSNRCQGRLFLQKKEREMNRDLQSPHLVVVVFVVRVVWMREG